MAIARTLGATETINIANAIDALASERGGISIALALSLAGVAEKPILLAATYAAVIFTIVVQGLSLRAVVDRFAGPL